MNIKQQVLALLKRDSDTRERLVQSGELFDGYHPEMEEVHNKNAEELEIIIDEHGWPTEVSEEAWVIVQHSISKPNFQRKCLEIIKQENVDPRWIAKLQDRICVFEGKPQVYGTHFEWDSDGNMSPHPIADLENVDSFRARIGLPPMQETLDEILERARLEGNKPPKNYEERQRKFLEWTVRVGWRQS